MKNILRELVYVCLFIGGAFLLIIVGICWFFWSQSYLPPEQVVREQFQAHRADYIRFAGLLRKEKSARWVERSGKVAIDYAHGRVVPEYAELIRKIGAQEVLVRGDGSIEFELWGYGCAICDDSFMGVRYLPKEEILDFSAKRVASLDSKKLPQHNGAVASGLYVVPIEPEWFIYRYEYRE